MTTRHRMACTALALICAALLLTGCNLEDSRLGDADLPYQLTLGTTYADVVLPATHADHWQFTAPTLTGSGDVTVEITTGPPGLNVRISSTVDGSGEWPGFMHTGGGLESDSTSGELGPGDSYYLIIDVPGGGGATYTLTVTEALS